MKRLFTLLAALVLLSGTAALAQEYVPTPVTVSKEKVKLNGKVYLSHVVLEKQTLYGISKAYGVTEEELYEANPTLKATGLQKNAILLVPFKESAAPVVEGQAQNYTEHTVRWYEDIDDIARRYNVSVKDIMDFNDLKSRKLSTRQVLKIPLQGAPEAAREKADDDDDKGLQALRNLVFYSTTQFTDAIPIMGSEITNVVDQFITGKRGFMQSGTDMTPSATKLLSALTNASKGNWEKAATLSAEAIGMAAGAPVSGLKEINKLLGKPLEEGDINLLRGISDVYGIAGDIIEE